MWPRQGLLADATLRMSFLNTPMVSSRLSLTCKRSSFILKEHHEAGGSTVVRCYTEDTQTQEVKLLRLRPTEDLN